MRITAERTFFWLPRVLTLLFAAFLSLFALDAFTDHAGFWATAQAFVMHLTPTLLLLLVLALTWHHEGLGGLLFLAMAGAYMLSAWGRFPAVTYLTIAGPVAVVGLLFLAHWFWQDVLEEPPPAGLKGD